MRRSEAESARRAASQQRSVYAGALSPEISGSQRIRQSSPRIRQDGLVALDMARREAIERCRNEQRADQMADPVKDRDCQASGAFDILGKRQIHARATGVVDAFHELIAIEDCSGRNPAKICGPEKSLAPVGRLECNKDDAEGAVQRNLPRERFDGLRLLWTKTPVHHDGLAALQYGKTAIFSRRLCELFNVRMNDLQQLPKWIERRGKRKKPRAEAIFAIFEPLKNSVFDQRAGDTGDRRHRQPNALTYVSHGDRSILRNSSNDPDGPVDDLDRHWDIFGQMASRHKANCGPAAVSFRMRCEAEG